MDLSIIIPSFNTKALLDRCLDSIVKSLHTSNISYEIIVVDNASKDGSQEGVKSQKSKVKSQNITLIQNKKNKGFAAANNQGIRASKGDYILLLNSDTVALKDAIKQLYAYCKLHAKSFVGGKLFNENMSPQPSCGPFYTIPVVALMMFVKGDYWGLTRYSPNKTQSIDWISGACIMSQKSSFIDVGLFDENIFMYMEDIEFLYRARKKGYAAFFFKPAEFIHTGSGSSANRRTPVVNIYRGLRYFYEKHENPMALWMLGAMLGIKALLAIQIGRIMRKQGLVQTYEEALSIR